MAQSGSRGAWTSEEPAVLQAQALLRPHVSTALLGLPGPPGGGRGSEALPLSWR